MTACTKLCDQGSLPSSEDHRRPELYDSVRVAEIILSELTQQLMSKKIFSFSSVF